MMDRIVLVLLLGFLGLVLMPALFVRVHRGPRRDTTCRSNLNQIYMALATYVDDFGGHRYYPRTAPGMSGADFLLAVYFNRIIENPDTFICDATEDTNHEGKDFIGRNVANDPRVSVGTRSGDGSW
ncbi:MAG: hypothetical protein V1809_16485 [Planctomycetota bacterium]